MKNNKVYTYIIVAMIVACSFVSSSMGQDSTAVGDTTRIIPIKDLPIISVKTTGDKKTGLLTTTIEFENRWSNTVDVSLSVGGWDNFGFTSDRGTKYKIYTYYNKLTDENPNAGFKKVSNIRFGEKVMDLATVLPQPFLPGEKKVFVFYVPTFDKLSKTIKEIHIHCAHYYQYGGGINSSGTYRITNLPINWK